MIFQEPMTSLSPVHTIGDQIMEAILLHRNMNKNEAKELTLEMLYKVGIPNPYQRINEYPHQLSGGLRQRAMIAMALSCNPSLLIADEPTTALDVTVQAQILELMKELQAEFGMSIMFITHNLGVIAEVSDEVMVMYLGKAVEYASVDEIFHNPLHPYTVRLLRSIPKVGKKARTRLDAIKGTVPLPLDLPPGCSFYPRCPEAKKGLCNKEDPSLVEVKKGHWVSCFLYK
ncbi:ABC transporter ATP-binding protein, partial [Candidatus Aerophobetes bacterium]|nr:ABC transporter ATP-binding protein [Candidatus Aerophobetes bacterium]